MTLENEVVALIRRIVDERVYAAFASRSDAERDAARADLAGVAAQRDAQLSRSVELAARVTELEALIGRKQLVNDALREELVAEQVKLKEAHDCVDKLTSEMRAAKLATPAVVEVDGFRVGDLVEYVADGGRYAKITDMSAGAGRSWISTMTCSVQTSALRRKPVEVGDTVRFAGISVANTCVVRSIQSNEVGVKWCYFDDDALARLTDCIAVAP